jgi:hypothetical protein
MGHEETVSACSWPPPPPRQSRPPIPEVPCLGYLETLHACHMSVRRRMHAWHMSVRRRMHAWHMRESCVPRAASTLLERCFVNGTCSKWEMGRCVVNILEK